MRDRVAVVLGMVAGALAGGVAGWLWLTDDGRRLRVRLEPHVKELAGRAIALSASTRRVQAAARQSAQTAHDVASRSAGR